MPTPVLKDTVTFDGREIAPGESFHPFPEQPDYVVTYVRIEGTTLYFIDCCGEFTETRS